MDAVTASLRTSHASLLVPSSRSRHMGHNSASSSYSFLHGVSATRCRPASSRSTLCISSSSRRRLAHHASSEASFSPTASVYVNGGGIDVSRGCIARRSVRTSGRGRRGDFFIIPRASSGDDDPEAASSYEIETSTTSPFPASIADARWFNTYVHGAVFVFILGKGIGYVHERPWPTLRVPTFHFVHSLKPLLEAKSEQYLFFIGWNPTPSPPAVLCAGRHVPSPSASSTPDTAAIGAESAPSRKRRSRR